MEVEKKIAYKFHISDNRRTYLNGFEPTIKFYCQM